MTTSIKRGNKATCDTTINVKISDFILTPVACALLVNEVFKNLLYQRSQIPYPYAWLKNVVKKKRESLEKNEQSGDIKNFTADRHYQVVSTAYDSAENIMSSVIKMFSKCRDKLKEVVFVIGTTPLTAKEVFTIQIPSLAYEHWEQNHAEDNSRKQPKILRSLFLENTWMDLVEKTLACSNTFIYLKLSESPVDSLENSMFVPSKPLLVPSNVKNTLIHFNYSHCQDLLCCGNLEVFEDVPKLDCMKNGDSMKASGLLNEDDYKFVWLQAEVSIKGFKDCFINKVSANELW